MNKIVAAITVAVVTLAYGQIAFGQQSRESAVANMRQLAPSELDQTYKQSAAFAQKLVNDELAAHPKVILIGLHVTPPNHPVNVIIASNFGRIGKIADKDDMRVIQTGVSNFDVEPAGKTFEAEMPIREKSGHIIGAVSVVFNFKPGDDKAAYTRESQAICKHMNAQITTLDKLFGPAE